MHFMADSCCSISLKCIPLEEEELSTVLCSRSWGITCFQKDEMKKKSLNSDILF